MDEKSTITFEVEFDKFGLSLSKVLETIEITLIEKFLSENEWNKAKAARLLNIERTTLGEKCKKFGLMHKPSEH